MNIQLDVASHKYKGEQILIYTNNSPDTIDRVFYHLYFNAFQPGSMMDVRSRSMPDPDPRLRGKIPKLADDEIGFIDVQSLKQDGVDIKYETAGTILEVELASWLLPGDHTALEMEFDAQVPLQTRRSGRDNVEGIAYSMSQWYPKLCEYDHQGWHANPYIGKEFYGVWGNFEVQIELDKSYIIGATGVLQNADEIGYGYSTVPVDHGDRSTLTWHFKAHNVHDFVWAADPEYTHTQKVMEDGTVLHFFYQENERTTDNWQALPAIMSKAWEPINERYGQYPYPVFSFIQGGDSGMEYPMATLITGERSIGSLVGVCIHELMHAWYQSLLSTNESLYAWMDEGFTTFAQIDIKNWLREKQLIPGAYEDNPYLTEYNGYRNIALSSFEEPLSTHADHFVTNTAYGVGSYTKGCVFLKQLEYVIGKEFFDQALLNYYYTWRFKHPDVNDFLRVFEKISGMELDWYKEYFVNTTHLIDYAVTDVKESPGGSRIVFLRNQVMPMPIDVEVRYLDGSKSFHTIPLQIMRGAKTMEGEISYHIEADWPWTNPVYHLDLDRDIGEVRSVIIDPTDRLADVDPSNDRIDLPAN